MEDKRNVEDDADDAEDVELQDESIDEAPSASDTSLTNTTKKISKEARTDAIKKSNKEARTLGEKMASALAEKRAIGSYESVDGTASSTTRIVDQRAKDLTTSPGERMAATLAAKRAIGSDEPADTRDTTVLMAEEPPGSSSAPPLAPTSLVQDQHYSRPGAFRVNPSHIASNGDDDDEESFYGVHITYDEPAIANQQRDLGELVELEGELVELEGTLAPENDRAGSRETDGEIGRAKTISEMYFFAQTKVQLGTVVAVLMIGLVVGLTFGGGYILCREGLSMTGP
jgi:hypothetical protein